jgi:hypothetical protein
MSNGLWSSIYPTLTLSREQKTVHFKQTIPILCNSFRNYLNRNCQSLKTKATSYAEMYFQKVRGLLEALSRRQLQTPTVTFGH